MAPLVVKNRVLVGASGGEFGIHGWLKALDLATGRPVWTAYTIGPDSEVLARAGVFRPFYGGGADLGLTSRPQEGWKNGGGPGGGGGFFGPAPGLVDYGVRESAPHKPQQPPGGEQRAA